MQRLIRFPLVLVAVLVAACASAEPAATGGAAGGPTPAGDGATLRVHNTDSRGEALTIFLVPQAGEHRRLGVVQPNEYLAVPHPAGEGRFQLRAQRNDGSAVTSPTFLVVSGTYTWDIALRRVDRAR